MARQNGIWVEYDPAGPTIVRVESSKLKALELAVEDSMKVAFVEYGQTIGEVLADQTGIKALVKELASSGKALGSEAGS